MKANNKYLLKYLKYKKKYLNLQGGAFSNLRFENNILTYDTTKRNIEPFQRLQVEIVTSYLTLYIGYYMQNIVRFFNNKFNTNINVSAIIDPNNFETMVNTNLLTNCIVPVGIDFVHWYYVDENNHIHNPYYYNMQINNSHQFCQTHALLLAFDPTYRTQTNPEAAYNKVILLWTEILQNINIITPDILQINNEIIRNLKNNNVSENQTMVDVIISVYFNDSNAINNIITVINSSVAHALAPYFK
jgi:hypothetical protein